ncbi:Unknown protein [Striga hermonthica]|uniref:Uncharacterized protein n=1 Tax=Striga hermonthica TaxID=68872 RepID=A0A9N7RJ92_STRHE|nr:Unknown protein [Striga hermonthica]
MAKNNKSGSRSKHIDIKYLAVRERVKEEKVVIEHIKTELMIADPLTKGMPPKNFKDHVVRMGLRIPSLHRNFHHKDLSDTHPSHRHHTGRKSRSSQFSMELKNPAPVSSEVYVGTSPKFSFMAASERRTV